MDVRCWARTTRRFAAPRRDASIEDSAVRRAKRASRVETKIAHTMKDISTYIPISKVKSNLSKIIRRLENFEEAVVVTKNGVPAAVILSMDKYQGLLETLDILSDEKAMKSLRTSLRQARKGKWVKYDEVFGR